MKATYQYMYLYFSDWLQKMTSYLLRVQVKSFYIEIIIFCKLFLRYLEAIYLAIFFYCKSYAWAVFGKKKVKLYGHQW